MCHASCLAFGKIALTKREIQGKRVLEVGSRDVNGSLRPAIELWKPAEYIGIDIRAGRGVDLVCDANDLVERFGRGQFDVVICTELFEHVEDWRNVISNIKQVCLPGGIILITTRSFGFPRHAYPCDFWRFELSDIEYIFADCDILLLQKDKDKRFPGVFLKARKPNNFIERDLSNHKLYSMISGTRE